MMKKTVVCLLALLLALWAGVSFADTEFLTADTWVFAKSNDQVEGMKYKTDGTGEGGMYTFKWNMNNNVVKVIDQWEDEYEYTVEYIGDIPTLVSDEDEVYVRRGDFSKLNLSTERPMTYFDTCSAIPSPGSFVDVYLIEDYYVEASSDGRIVEDRYVCKAKDSLADSKALLETYIQALRDEGLTVAENKGKYIVSKDDAKLVTISLAKDEWAFDFEITEETVAFISAMNLKWAEKEPLEIDEKSLGILLERAQICSNAELTEQERSSAGGEIMFTLMLETHMQEGGGAKISINMLPHGNFFASEDGTHYLYMNVNDSMWTLYEFNEEGCRYLKFSNASGAHMQLICEKGHGKTYYPLDSEIVREAVAQIMMAMMKK